MNKKYPYTLALRNTRESRYTWPVLIGALERRDLSRPVRWVAGTADLADLGAAGGSVALCYSVLTPNIGRIPAEVRKVRGLLKDRLLLIAGGAHATADPVGTLKLGFDVVFEGEADRTFPALIERLSEGDWETVRGARIRDETGPFDINEGQPFTLRENVFAPQELTRGCFYGCRFCAISCVFPQKVRHLAVFRLREFLVESQKRKYRNIFFITPNALAYGASRPGEINYDALEDLLETLQDLGISPINLGIFPSEVRPDYVNERSAGLLRRYCRNRKIVLGCQSGSDRVLRLMGRGHGAEEVMRSTQLLAQAGFVPHCDLLFCIPGETDEDRAATRSSVLQMINRFGAVFHAHCFMPFPGTAFWGKEPEPLDSKTRDFLTQLEREGRLDGWWREQEAAARDIIRWREAGIITV
jgi:B12-binding domain/radical SAM domain protein